jgi:hypothetical protein
MLSYNFAQIVIQNIRCKFIWLLDLEVPQDYFQT